MIEALAEAEAAPRRCPAAPATGPSSLTGTPIAGMTTTTARLVPRRNPA